MVPMPPNPMQQDASHSEEKGGKRWRKAEVWSVLFWHIDKKLIRACKQEVSVCGSECAEQFKVGKQSAVLRFINTAQLGRTSLKLLNKPLLLHDRIDTVSGWKKSASSRWSTGRWGDFWRSLCLHQCWAAWLPPLKSAPTPSYQGPKVTPGTLICKYSHRLGSIWSVFKTKNYLKFVCPDWV